MSLQVATPSASSPAAGRFVRFGYVVQSEWTKLRTLRSTRRALVALFIVVVGLSALICVGVVATYDEMSPADRTTFDRTATSLAGMGLGQLAVVVLGVLLIAGEYSSGGIRATLIAVPRRLDVLAAKAVVLVSVTLVAGTVTSLAAFAIGQAVLGSKGVEAHLGDPGGLRAVLGGSLYLTASSLFAFGLGTLLRKSSGAITASVAGLIVLPIFTALVPGSWGDAIQRYFTSNAGTQITAVQPTGNTLGPWMGFFVFLLWTALVVAVGAVSMQRRDA